MRTRVVNLYKHRYDVYIGRRGQGLDGYFGNPYRQDVDAANNRDTMVAAFKTYFLARVAADPEYRRRVLELKGKILGCYCAPRPCHGDVIVEWLEGPVGDPPC